jgi:hypothetical protein
MKLRTEQCLQARSAPAVAVAHLERWAKKTMSVTQSAFLDKTRVPARGKLEESIRSLGFDLAIDESYRPFECSGFLPCVLNGKESGFEIYFDSPKEALEAFPHLAEEVGTRDCKVTFRVGGDMAECACMLIVCAALVTSFESVVHYDADDIAYSAEGLIEEAQSALNAVR